MTTLYALVGMVTDDLLTYHGRPIVHTDRAELEYLIDTSKTRVVAVTARDLAQRSPAAPLLLRDHPGLAHLTWPLRREDFVHG